MDVGHRAVLPIRGGDANRRPGSAFYRQPAPGTYRLAPLTTKSASRSPHSVQRNSRAQSGTAYSITSSARARIDGGTVRPSTLAVLRLMKRLNVVGCWTGSSAGLAPLRILPA